VTTVSTARPAKVSDKLTTHNFGTGTRGFAASEATNVAVCVLPGTELSFAEEVRCFPTGLIAWRDKVIAHKTAIFRQINKDKVAAQRRLHRLTVRTKNATRWPPIDGWPLWHVACLL
jgi:hypothetical protein